MSSPPRAPLVRVVLVVSFAIASLVAAAAPLGARRPDTPVVSGGQPAVPARSGAAPPLGRSSFASDDAPRSAPEVEWPEGREAMPIPRAADRAAAGAGDARAVYVWPPTAAIRGATAPQMVVLHGMCGDGSSMCDFWNAQGRAAGWLVCPDGNGTCGDSPDWRGSGEEKARWIDAARAAVRSAHGELVASAGDDLLVGYSRGAYVARDVIYARPGVYRAAVFLGAAVDPDPARFRASGIRRVVLAAADFDGARPTMLRAARRLGAAGIPARFVGLGPMGHGVPADLGERMAEPLRWVVASGGVDER